jgi:hypothetical protein
MRFVDAGKNDEVVASYLSILMKRKKTLRRSSTYCTVCFLVALLLLTKSGGPWLLRLRTFAVISGQTHIRKYEPSDPMFHHHHHHRRHHRPLRLGAATCFDSRDHREEEL